jgi:hypothetical protein
VFDKVKGENFMSKLNAVVKNSYQETAHKNFMNGNSWDISNNFKKLLIVGASSFFGEPKYYDETGKITTNYAYSNEDQSIHNYIEKSLGKAILRPAASDEDSASWQDTIQNLIVKCLDEDIEKTLQVAVDLRNNYMIRSTPQVILVLAAMHKNSKGTGLIGKYIDKICIRGDEPAAGLAYFFSNCCVDKKSIPNSLKRGWKKVLESFDDYVISKYRMENNFVKTRDVVNLVHAYSEPIHKLMNGNAKQERTWNNIVSNANKSEKTKTEIWREAMHNMPHMALLRNISNLTSAGIDPSEYAQKLISGVEHGKQLPFRYYSAYKANKDFRNPKIDDMLEMCMKESFKNAPHFDGKVVCLSDNSGSAWGTLTSELGSMKVAEIGNMMSVATAMMGDEGYVGAFGDRLEMMPVRKTDSMLTQTQQLSKLGSKVGGGTENGIWLFFDKAIKNKEHYDHIFVYSDMQCGHGGLYGNRGAVAKEFVWEGDKSRWNSYIDVPKLINKYRAEVNKNVMVYLVQTAGYQDILVPECYNRTFILGGWSQNIPMFAAKMSEIFN